LLLKPTKNNWKHAKNNVRWPVITTPNLNCCLSSCNERKFFFNSFHFFHEKHTIPGVVLRTSSIAFITEKQLTYHNTFKRVWLGKSNIYSQPYSFPWYTYVSLVTTFAHSNRHMNLPCYKFETILDRQSKSDYLHTWRTLRVITWHRLRVDIFWEGRLINKLRVSSLS